MTTDTTVFMTRTITVDVATEAQIVFNCNGQITIEATDSGRTYTSAMDSCQMELLGEFLIDSAEGARPENLESFQVTDNTKNRK